MRYNCHKMSRNAEESPPVLGQTEAGVDLLNLVDFLVKFRSVERRIHIPSLGRAENDTEHSFDLAMAALNIVVRDKLPLDQNLVIKYSLVHDLVEVHAGDTFAFDNEAAKDKAAREHAAMQELGNDELTAVYAEIAEEYERLDNEESRFVYGLDKLMAAFTVIHGQVSIWRENDVTRAIFVDKFEDKVLGSAHLRPYWEECLRLLDENPSLLVD